MRIYTEQLTIIKSLGCSRVPPWDAPTKFVFKSFNPLILSSKVTYWCGEGINIDHLFRKRSICYNIAFHKKFHRVSSEETINFNLQKLTWYLRNTVQIFSGLTLYLVPYKVLNMPHCNALFVIGINQMSREVSSVLLFSRCNIKQHTLGYVRDSSLQPYANISNNRLQRLRYRH